MSFDKLLFGTAGIPITTPDRNTLNGIAYVRELKLDVMELEFVRSINIKKELAPEVKQAAKKNGVILTCHAPYYINLNSHEKAKARASVGRILNSARIAGLCGAFSVCFHAGFYQKDEPEKVYNNIKDAMEEITKTLKDEGNDIWVRPETTGKASQFGSIKELLNLSAELDNVMPCIDFSHLCARENGKVNSYQEFSKVLEETEKVLGKAALNNMHIHASGIEYTDKGERRHLILNDSEFKYKELLKALKEFKAKGVVISESPNIEKDALLMKKTYENI
tara:strand:- start:19505 stop:20341 length:837 start_codon:yes stop_codon:yes gene_type:complete